MISNFHTQIGLQKKTLGDKKAVPPWTCHHNQVAKNRKLGNDPGQGAATDILSIPQRANTLSQIGVSWINILIH